MIPARYCLADGRTGHFLFLKKKRKRDQSLEANNSNGFKEIKISIDTDHIDPASIYVLHRWYVIQSPH